MQKIATRILLARGDDRDSDFGGKRDGTFVLDLFRDTFWQQGRGPHRRASAGPIDPRRIDFAHAEWRIDRELYSRVAWFPAQELSGNDRAVFDE